MYLIPLVALLHLASVGEDSPSFAEDLMCSRIGDLGGLPISQENGRGMRENLFDTDKGTGIGISSD